MKESNVDALAQDFARWGKRAIGRVERGVKRYGSNSGRWWVIGGKG